MKWKDINEEAPKAGGLYLVTDGEEVEVMAYYGTYKGAHDWSSYTCNTLDVTQWMELPKVPNDTLPFRYVYMSKEELKEIYPDAVDKI